MKYNKGRCLDYPLTKCPGRRRAEKKRNPGQKEVGEKGK